MSDAMDLLKSSLYLDKIPPTWMKRAWPSLRPLQSWLSDFMGRLNQLEEWSNNPLVIPKVTIISSLYNPQSFLTAICQVTAQKDKEELDKLVTQTDIQTKMTVEDANDNLDTEGHNITGDLPSARLGGLPDLSNPL